jgi:type II secretory pathway pseudopilin PulG
MHHDHSLRHFAPRGKLRSPQRAFALVEITLALSMLTIIGLFMLKISLDILAPRQWAMQQALSDAHMTYERAYAERLPFDNLLANNSPWPAFPDTATTAVEIGRLPGGTPVTGTIHRTRLPDEENYPVDGGSGNETNNPAAMKVWKVQSVLTYQIGGRAYAKSRTVIRSQ